jgi:hypothetical protein
MVKRCLIPCGNGLSRFAGFPIKPNDLVDRLAWLA